MSKWTQLRDKLKSNLKAEFERVRDSETTRFKQSSTYVGLVGLATSGTAATQIDPSEYWMAILTSVISLCLIRYRQKKHS